MLLFKYLFFVSFMLFRIFRVAKNEWMNGKKDRANKGMNKRCYARKPMKKKNYNNEAKLFIFVCVFVGCWCFTISNLCCICEKKARANKACHKVEREREWIFFNKNDRRKKADERSKKQMYLILLIIL